MGFYLRKSVRVGPLRFNLSKSGVGVSAGVKGFRLGTGPRGNYVHVGRGGLYYRKTLPPAGPGSSSPALPQPSPEPSADGLAVLEGIESGAVREMRDSSSDDLLEEIQEKRRKLSFWPFAAVPAGLTLFLLLSASAPQWTVILLLVVAVPLTVWLAIRDELRRTVVLMYELEPPIEAAYTALHKAFDAVRACGRVWNLEAQGRSLDVKRSAGATHIVRRQPIRVQNGEPAGIKVNLPIPALPAGKETLYFLPERVLVYQGRNVGAVSYADLRISTDTSRFIETESVPKDAEIVDRTWRYVNKKGGPDRRFKDNLQIPVALYGELALHSSTGLNEIFQISKADVPEIVKQAVAGLRNALAEQPT